MHLFGQRRGNGERLFSERGPVEWNKNRLVHGANDHSFRAHRQSWDRTWPRLTTSDAFVSVPRQTGFHRGAIIEALVRR